jgi:hypothetical protein
MVIDPLMVIPIEEDSILLAISRTTDKFRWLDHGHRDESNTGFDQFAPHEVTASPMVAAIAIKYPIGFASKCQGILNGGTCEQIKGVAIVVLD